jgi:23S rRNA pseudouridine2457 synthase
LDGSALSFKYYKFNKPFGVLSQFRDKLNRKTLSLFYDFPKDVYSIGRLDYDSEGLLLLTNDKEITDYLLNPVNKHEKEYLVQVEGEPDECKLNNLREGVLIKSVRTLPAKVKKINEPGFSPRIPPVRCRKNISTSWLNIIITEGKHRQVRKMTASIGHPTLRLIRIRIKEILLNGLKPGEVQELNPEEIKALLD